MVKASIVIGSNFGDEGKGMTTDFLASRSSRSVVIRFNGGAQAGHTVELPDGRRHVFSHFGSGTMANAATFLSRFFIISPSFFKKEREALVNLGFNPSVYVDKDAIVTTPYDILINRLLETRRGINRHGSVGLGINETVTRNLANGGRYAITGRDLDQPAVLRDVLSDIKENYVPRRLEQLEIKDDVAFDDVGELIDEWLADCETFVKQVSFIDQPSKLMAVGFDNFVFEGAQGLLLDEDHEYFPHVTRSKTGVRNAIKVANEIGIKCADVYYVTRPYMTRHGAGPFLTYDPSMKFEDITNVPNDWQETMRFGKLDVVAWGETVRNDITKNYFIVNGFTINNIIPVLTWYEHDGMDVNIDFYGEAQMTYRALANLLSTRIGASHTLISKGKTRENFEYLYQ